MIYWNHSKRKIHLKEKQTKTSFGMCVKKKEKKMFFFIYVTYLYLLVKDIFYAINYKSETKWIKKKEN